MASLRHRSNWQELLIRKLRMEVQIIRTFLAPCVGCSWPFHEHAYFATFLVKRITFLFHEYIKLYFIIVAVKYLGDYVLCLEMNNILFWKFFQ